MVGQRKRKRIRGRWDDCDEDIETLRQGGKQKRRGGKKEETIEQRSLAEGERERVKERETERKREIDRQTDKQTGR